MKLEEIRNTEPGKLAVFSGQQVTALPQGVTREQINELLREAPEGHRLALLYAPPNDWPALEDVSYCFESVTGRGVVQFTTGNRAAVECCIAYRYRKAPKPGRLPFDGSTVY